MARFLLAKYCDNLSFAAAYYYGVATNMEAELNALLDGLSQCHLINIKDLIIETDSLTLSSAVQCKASLPWKCLNMLHYIWHLMKETRATIVHSYRKNKRVFILLPFVFVVHRRQKCLFS